MGKPGKDSKGGKPATEKTPGKSVFSEAINTFIVNGDFNMSAAIAFYAMFSHVPILLLLVSGAGFFLEHYGGSLDTFYEMLSGITPALGLEFEKEIAALERRRGLIGGVGIFVLLWSASLVFSSIEFAFNIIFNVGNQRSFIRSRLISLSMIILGVAVLVGSILLTTVAKTAKAYSLVIGGVNLTRFFMDSLFFQYALPFFLLALTFSMIYLILPRVKIRLADAVLGGTLCAFFFEGAKYLFTWYVGNLGSHSLIYGSLGALVVIILWFFYVAAIILFCGEVIAAEQRRRKNGL